MLTDSQFIILKYKYKYYVNPMTHKGHKSVNDARHLMTELRIIICQFGVDQ